MFPGSTTKLSEGTVASAASITAVTDVIRLTGATDVATINPSFGGGFSGMLIIIPVDGAVNLLDTGNIAVAVAMPQNRATLLVFSKTDGQWYPGAIS